MEKLSAAALQILPLKLKAGAVTSESQLRNSAIISGAGEGT